MEQKSLLYCQHIIHDNNDIILTSFTTVCNIIQVLFKRQSSWLEDHPLYKNAKPKVFVDGFATKYEPTFRHIHNVTRAL